jgi:hypothetical protein
MDNSKFETEVLSLLAALKIRKQKIQEQFEVEMKAVDSQIEAVSTTARLLRHGASSTPTIVARGLVIPDLTGKNIRQACIEIAKRNDGIVRVKETKNALVAAGVVRRTKNSWGIVNTTLLRSKEFQKHPTELGTFKLVDTEQGQLSVA